MPSSPGRRRHTAGPTGELDCGNGSLMRILPIALVAAASGPRGVASATEPAKPIASVGTTSLVEQAFAASRVTHGHPRAQVACALYTLAAVRLLAGERDRDRALEQSRITLSRADHVGALDHLMAWPTRNGRSRVWDSFWSAWDAFAGAGSYRETIERAIAYGNDTDTTAAIAGGLAGIYWGIDGIPLEWLDGMRGDVVADPLVDRLLARQGWRTSTTNPLRVDWVDLANVPGLRGAAAAGGRLGMTFLPGKQRDGWTGMHWRNLRSDAARLDDPLGADTLVLLVEDHELEQARVPDIAAAMAEAGIDLIRFPIADMDVTSDRDGLRRVLDGILGRMVGGRSVLVACRGGLGRTGTIVGCLLRDGGLDAPGAIALTRASRKDTIERGTQIDFIHAWDWPPREALA